MANWTTENQPFGGNRAPLLVGVSESDGKSPIPVAVDPATGRLLVNSVGGASATSVAINDGVTTSLKATVASLTDSNPLATMIVDGSGNQITSFGGGTQYTDGGTPPTHPVGPTLEWNNAGTWATAGSAAPLPVTANAGTNLNTSALATSANLTAGTQKTQVVDGSGNVIASTSNALNVSVTNSAVGSDTNDGAGNAITSNSTTTTSTRGLDINIRSILNTAPTTAGFLDIKGADGNVFVRQGTAANLKATAYLNDGSGNSIGSTGGALNVNISSGNITGFATSANQTNASQKTQIVDGSGNVIASTSNALNVDITNSTLSTYENASASATGFSNSYTGSFTNSKVPVKASAGILAGWHLYNPNNAVTYVQVFNLASGSVTLGSTSPTFVIVIPSNGWEDFSPIMPGIAMGTAITVAATTTATGSTAPVNTLTATFFYI